MRGIPTEKVDPTVKDAPAVLVNDVVTDLPSVTVIVWVSAVEPPLLIVLCLQE